MQVRGCGENYLRHFLGTPAINLKFGHFFAPKLDQIRSSVDVLYGSSLQKPSARNDRLLIFDNVDRPKRQLPILNGNGGFPTKVCKFWCAQRSSQGPSPLLIFSILVGKWQRKIDLPFAFQLPGIFYKVMEKFRKPKGNFFTPMSNKKC